MVSKDKVGFFAFFKLFCILQILENLSLTALTGEQQVTATHPTEPDEQKCIWMLGEISTIDVCVTFLCFCNSSSQSVFHLHNLRDHLTWDRVILQRPEIVPSPIK